MQEKDIIDEEELESSGSNRISGPNEDEPNDEKKEDLPEPGSNDEEEPELNTLPKSRPILDQYTLFDFNQGMPKVAATLYGLMSDVLTKAQMDAIYRKINFFDMINREDKDAAEAVYPEFASATRLLKMEEEGELEAEDLYKSGEAPKNDNYMGKEKMKFKRSEFEKPEKLFREGMQELIKAMDTKLQTKSFKSVEEENYFIMMRGVMEDLSEGKFTEKILNNPLYEYAMNLLQKIRSTVIETDKDPAGRFTAKYADGFNSGDKKTINDGQIVRNLRETGMIEAACGAKKTTDMLEEHLSTGDTTRDELLAEYKLQVKRMEKALSISKNDFTKLKIKKVFDNDWEEFTADAGRGFGWALEDAKARVQLLEAGYPASDMYAVSSFVRILSGLESRLSRAQEYINKNEVRDEKTLPDDAKRNLEENREIVREYTPAIAEMRKIWEKAVSGKSLTPAKRLENLRSLRSCAEEIFQNYKVKGTNLKDRSVFELDKLIAAKPSAYDRVMMTGDISEMYTFLGKVDKNVISSDQFSDMKRELKALAEMQKTALANRNVDPFGDTGAAYKKQYDKTLEAISTYLRYKTRQLNNPLKKHTRSEREARRVRMAEAIFSSMKKQNYPGTKTELLNDLAKEHKRAVGDGIDTEMLRPAQEPEKASSKPERVFIRNYKKDGLPVDYDSYINLHTGRAAANGTRQEMIGDLSKVMAAVMLKKKFEKYPGILTAFNLERVHAAAKEIRKEFGLDTIRDDQLRLFLADPSKAARMAGEVSAMQYGLNEKVKPDDYIEQMRRVYLQLPSPISKDGAPRNGAMSLKTNGYRDMFKAVETIAHLPKTTEMEGLDTDRLREKISSCNYQLINGAGKFVLNNAKAASNKKGMSGYTQSAMNAYVTAARSIGCGKSILVDMEFDINEKRMSFGKGSSGYEKGWTQIKTADYGPQKLDEPIETRNINKAVFAKMKSEFKLREKNEKTGSKGLQQNVKKEGNKKLKEIKLPGKK